MEGEEALGEILVIPFFGQGHLNPCMELCQQIASHKFKAIFIIPSNLSSSVPPTFDNQPFIEAVEIPNQDPSPEPTDGSGSGTGSGSDPGAGNIDSGAPPRGMRRRRRPLVPGIESFLSERYTNSGQTRPGCVVIDVMMNWSRDIFMKLNIPIVSFFTSGACTSAMEYAKAKENFDNIGPGETRVLPALPESMALSYADIKRQQGHHHFGGGRPGEPGRRRFAPPNEPGSENGPPEPRRPGPEPGRRFPPPNEQGSESGPPEPRRPGPPEPGRRRFPPPNEQGSESGPPEPRRPGPPEPGRRRFPPQNEPVSESGPPEPRRPGHPEPGRRRFAPPNEPDSESGPPEPRRPGPPEPGRRRFAPPNEPDSESGLQEPRRPGPPGPGFRAPWWEQAQGSIALLFNTSYDLDSAFINYIANQIGKPVWGVGPMLPEQYWGSSGSIVHDHEVRSNRESTVTEDEVLQWLDSKPAQSVIYISFGSEVGPTMEEFEELANALEESNRPFIWVIQPGSGIPGPPRSLLGEKAPTLATEGGYYPHGLDEKVGERGLIIKGWAPQLLILSHPSVGGFLSHCGWNSTVEAIGRGVPILAWPIRGDQFYNAKLVVDHLKIAHTLLKSDDPFATMKKDEIKRGVEMLMDDEEVHKKAMAIGDKFQHGFPASSEASLKEFIELVGEEMRKRQLGS